MANSTHSQAGHSSSHGHSDLVSGEFNLVAHWLRWDPKRIIAGLMAGMMASLIMIVFAMVLSLLGGKELWYPVKVVAVPFLGASAMDFGNMTSVLVGFIFAEFLGAIHGAIYAQLTGTNQIGPLLGVGLVWGVLSWIFITCLFIQSFPEIFALQLSVGAAFPINLVFGLALTSVAFFDRMLRGGRA